MSALSGAGLIRLTRCLPSRNRGGRRGWRRSLGSADERVLAFDLWRTDLATMLMAIRLWLSRDYMLLASESGHLLDREYDLVL